MYNDFCLRLRIKTRNTRIDKRIPIKVPRCCIINTILNETKKAKTEKNRSIYDLERKVREIEEIKDKPNKRDMEIVSHSDFNNSSLVFKKSISAISTKE